MPSHMHNATPTLSLIVPVHNAERWIGMAIQSALGQSFPDFEIVVVDDGSTDGSCATVEHLLTAPRLRLLTQKNQGVSVARNRGLATARGRYVCFLDADDLLAPELFAKVVPILESEKALDFVLFNYFEFKGDTGSPSEVFAQNLAVDSRAASPRRMRHPLRDYLALLGNQVLTAVWLFCFRREALDGLGFRRGVTIGEDAEFLFRFLRHAREGFYLPYIGYLYRFVRGSASRTLEADFFDKRIIMFALIAESFQDAPSLFRLVRKGFTAKVVKSSWKMVYTFSFFGPQMAPRCESFLETLFRKRLLRLSDFSLRWQWRFLAAWWRAYGGWRRTPKVWCRLLGSGFAVALGVSVAGLVFGPAWLWWGVLVGVAAVFAAVSARALFWWPRRPAGVPAVLMLHSVSEGIAEPEAPNNSIRPPALRRLILDLLADGYAFRTLREAFAEPCHRRTMVLTFDDGFVDNFTELFPMLRELGVPATCFVTDRRGPRFLSDDQIREMARSGLVEFGGHTAGHVHLARDCDEATARAEIAANKRTIEALVGEPIVSFAYPFGDFGEREERLAREAGYRYAVTTRKREAHADALRIPRQIVPRDMGRFGAYLLATRGKRRL